MEISKYTEGYLKGKEEAEAGELRRGFFGDECDEFREGYRLGWYAYFEVLPYLISCDDYEDPDEA